MDVSLTSIYLFICIYVRIYIYTCICTNMYQGDIRIAFEDHLETLEWMDSNTRESAGRHAVCVRACVRTWMCVCVCEREREREKERFT